MVRYCILFLVFFLLAGCSKGPQEEIISRYPGGNKLETGVFSGEKSNRSRLKSYEYYETGERKKEFTHKDNHFFGPWTFWYRDGKIIAKGEISEKTMAHENAVGTGTYYWPTGKKMIDIAPTPDHNGTVVTSIYNEQGQGFPSDNAPPELSRKIKDLLDQWQAGKI